MYSGETVLLILDVVYQEAEIEIEKSFEDGYKAGLLELAPENAKLEATVYNMIIDTEKIASENTVLKKQIKSEKLQIWWKIPVSIVSGVAIGFITSGILQVVM